MTKQQQTTVFIAGSTLLAYLLVLAGANLDVYAHPAVTVAVWIVGVGVAIAGTVCLVTISVLILRGRWSLANQPGPSA